MDCIEIESEATRLQMLRAVGARCAEAPLGSFLALLATPFQGVGDVPVEDYAPSLTATTAQAQSAGVRVGVRVTLGERSFVVRSDQPDGTGMSVFVLEDA